MAWIVPKQNWVISYVFVDDMRRIEGDTQYLYEEQSGVSQSIGSLNGKVNTANDRVDALNNYISAVNRQVDNLNSNIAAANRRVDATNVSINNTQSRIDGLNGRVTAQQQTISGLASQLRKVILLSFDIASTQWVSDGAVPRRYLVDLTVSGVLDSDVVSMALYNNTSVNVYPEYFATQLFNGVIRIRSFGQVTIQGSLIVAKAVAF